MNQDAQWGWEPLIIYSIKQFSVGTIGGAIGGVVFGASNLLGRKATIDGHLPFEIKQYYE